MHCFSSKYCSLQQIYHRQHEALLSIDYLYRSSKCQMLINLSTCHVQFYPINTCLKPYIDCMSIETIAKDILMDTSAICYSKLNMHKSWTWHCMLGVRHPHHDLCLLQGRDFCVLVDHASWIHVVGIFAGWEWCHWKGNVTLNSYLIIY